MPTLTAPPQRRRAAVIFIFITVLLDMLALGMVIPVLPELVREFSGGDTALAARTLGGFNTLWALMQFFASPMAGALSDRFGRRPLVLLSNLGLGADYIFMALAPTLGWLLVGRVISGITSATVPTGYAYIADITAPEKRAKAFGLMGAAFGIGFVIGPAVGGLLGHYGPRLPFWVAGGCSLANFVYGLVVLPESLPAERRSVFSLKRANPVGSIALLREDRRLVWFGAMHFLYYLAHASLPSVFVLYASYRYGWDTQQVGYVLAAVGVTFAIVQGGLVGPIVNAIGERRALLLGLLSGAAGFATYGLAPTGRWYLAGIPIMGLWGLYGPSSQSLMTKRIGPSRQGQLQGALGSIVGMANIVAPTIFSAVFAAALSTFRSWRMPGAPFLLAAALLLVAAGLGLRATGGGELGIRD
jgi:DHA1 family tetracycline resistance protein-like MFS transporter